MNNAAWWAEFLDVVKKNSHDPKIQNMTPREVFKAFQKIPYDFNPQRKTRTFAQSLKDNTGACAEAAAAIAAALSINGIPFEACYKLDALTGAAHIVIISSGVTFDPYQDFFPNGVACAEKPEFFPV